MDDCCMVAKPRWFILVFRTVGLMGDGGTGDFIGDLRGVKGVLSDKAGLVAEAVEMLKDNFGLADREASILVMFWLM